MCPYLVEMAKADWSLDGSPVGLFPAIRPIGVRAEAAMFAAATAGVNTHKGIIFSLGIIAACLGYRVPAHRRFGPLRSAGTGRAGHPGLAGAGL